MKKWREIAAVLLGIVLFLGVTYTAGKVLLPVRGGYGATWDKYLQEERDSLDVLCFGSSLVYCDVVPAVVWKESGLTSYVMAGPEQTPPITSSYVREACKTQSPQAIVVELNGLFFSQFPERVKPNVLYMPWGADRVRATLRGLAREDWPEMFFPLYGDHDRVYSVTPSEVKRNLFPEPDQYAGYTLLTNAAALSQPENRSLDTTTETYRENIGCLREISQFCAQREIVLVFYLAPVYANIPQSGLDALAQDLDTIPHALFFNANGEDWPEFDPQTQWYDGLHLNLRGAVPFSQRLAEELQGLGLESEHSGGALWQERYDLIVKGLAEMEAAS